MKRLKELSRRRHFQGEGCMLKYAQCYQGTAKGSIWLKWEIAEEQKGKKQLYHVGYLVIL